MTVTANFIVLLFYYYICIYIVEFVNSSQHSVVKQTELQKELDLSSRRTIYGALEYLIVLMWASPLHGLWLAAGKVSGGNSLYMPASLSHCCRDNMAASAILLLHFPFPSRVGSGLWGGMSSFKPGGLCGSNLDNDGGGGESM